MHCDLPPDAKPFSHFPL